MSVCELGGIEGKFLRRWVEKRRGSSGERRAKPSTNHGTPFQASSGAQHVYHKQPFVKLQPAVYLTSTLPRHSSASQEAFTSTQQVV
jgi:hypothetical protein